MGGAPGVHVGESSSSVFGEDLLKCDVSRSSLFQGPPESSIRSFWLQWTGPDWTGGGQEGGRQVLGEGRPWWVGAGGSQGCLGLGGAVQGMGGGLSLRLWRE